MGDRDMETIYWPPEAGGLPGERSFREAGEALRAGEIVAIPTETVYGLAADAANDRAVAGIFTAKGRPSDNPLIVHIADYSQLEPLTPGLAPEVERLAALYWPGPLTLVLPVRPGAVSPLVTAGLNTVAIRWPAHPAAQRIIAAAERPLAAPSANRSGKPSPTTAAHVLADLGGRIYGVLDGGPAAIGLESTVLQPAEGRLHILRPGAVTADELRAHGFDVADRADGAAPPEPAAGTAGRMPLSDVPDSVIPAPEEFRPRAPGMKYTHYAPQGTLVLVQGATPEAAAAAIEQELARAKARGEVTGVLAFRERLARYAAADIAVDFGSETRLAEAAGRLYGALRAFDEAGAAYILAETCPEAGLGAAIMNRLRKAAGGRILRV